MRRLQSKQNNIDSVFNENKTSLMRWVELSNESLTDNRSSAIAISKVMVSLKWTLVVINLFEINMKYLLQMSNQQFSPSYNVTASFYTILFALKSYFEIPHFCFCPRRSIPAFECTSSSTTLLRAFNNRNILVTTNITRVIVAIWVSYVAMQLIAWCEICHYGYSAKK